jgi:hypothetical protein
MMFLRTGKRMKEFAERRERELIEDLVHVLAPLLEARLPAVPDEGEGEPQST